MATDNQPNKTPGGHPPNTLQSIIDYFGSEVLNQPVYWRDRTSPGGPVYNARFQLCTAEGEEGLYVRPGECVMGEDSCSGLPPDVWERLNTLRVKLINQKADAPLSDTDETVLAALQIIASLHVNAVAPLPFEALAAMQAELDAHEKRTTPASTSTVSTGGEWNTRITDGAGNPITQLNTQFSGLPTGQAASPDKYVPPREIEGTWYERANAVHGCTIEYIERLVRTTYTACSTPGTGSEATEVVYRIHVVDASGTRLVIELGANP